MEDNTRNKKRILILYICTGQYWRLFEGAFKSISDKLFPELEKAFYVWTDHEKEIEDVVRMSGLPNEVRILHKDFKPWPDVCMTRMQTFLPVQDDIAVYDYAMFVNANVLVTDTVPFSVTGGRLWAVRHAHFAHAVKIGDARIVWSTTEHNPKSEAYIPFSKCPYDYVFSGFVGGETRRYLDMVNVLAYRADKDMEAGIIPLWHDESLLNRYVLDTLDEFTLLDPRYLWPEEIRRQDKAPIVLRKKEWFFRSNTFRDGCPSPGK